MALRALREGSPESSHEVIDRCLVKLEDATASGQAPPPVEVHLRQSPLAVRNTGLLEEAIRSNRQARIDYYVPTRDETTTAHGRPARAAHQRGPRLPRRVVPPRPGAPAVPARPDARRRDRRRAREQQHDLTPRDLSDGLFEPGPDDVEAVLHLERYARWVADYYPVDSVEELGDGRLEARLRVGDPRWLVRLALRVAPGLTVRRARRVSAEVARTARSTLALYDRV